MKTKKDITHRFKGDVIIWTVICFLCVYSALAVYSGIAQEALKDGVKNARFFQEHLYLLRHLFILIAGLFIMWLVHLVKWHNALQKVGLGLVIISAVLLIITILFGKEVAGARRWLDFGLFSFQTSDAAKLALIIYLSSVFCNIRKYDKDFKSMALWVYLPVCIICALIAKENNSTAALLFVTVIVLMFFAHIPIKKILTLIGLTIAGMAIVLSIFFVITKISGSNEQKTASGATRMNTFVSRLKVWNSKDLDPNSQSFLASLAIAKGGLTGKMPGKSEQRYALSNIESDYIFAIIVEEYGLLFGAIPIVILFSILMFRGIRISLASPRLFSTYLVFGITLMYVIQAFINILVSVNLFPVTGQPMPFVSKGGSMFIMCCVAFGLILSESRVISEEKMQQELAEAKEIEAEPEPEFGAVEIKEATI